MIITILILNIIMLLLILGINRSIESLFSRIVELEFDVEGTREKLDEIFPDREITEDDV